MPDDAEMQASGIGAYNTPLQQLADNAGANGLRMQFDESWFVQEGSPGLTIDFNQSTERPIQHGGVDISMSVPDCVPGDLLLCHGTAVFIARACQGTVSMVLRDGMNDNYISHYYVGDLSIDSLYSPMSFLGLHKVDAGGNIRFTMNFQFITGIDGSSMLIAKDMVTMMATRWRVM